MINSYPQPYTPTKEEWGAIQQLAVEQDWRRTMDKKQVQTALTHDWQEHTSSLPKEGVLYPKGQDRTELVERMRKAFSKTKVRQAT